MSRLQEVASRDVRKHWRDILDTVMSTKNDIVVTRYGKRIAVIISAEDYEAVSEQLEDVRLSRLADSVYSEYLENKENAVDYEEVRSELMNDA